MDDNSAELSETGEHKESPPVAQVNLSLQLPPGMRVRVTVEALSDQPGGMEGATGRTVFVSDGAGDEAGPLSVVLPVYSQGATAVHQPAAQARPLSGLGRAVARLQAMGRSWPYSLEMTLFGLSLLVYLAVRLVGLASYPIYFFSDEAVQTVLAADLVRENLKNADGEFLPTYFYNVDKYSLGTTVYIQTLPYLLFGKSVFATRATSVFLTLIAAICVGLILRDAFKLPYWWAGTLLLSIAPAWFLHSRTAFETVTFVSFYTGGLYVYLLYRYRSPRFLYFALILFALAFYTYNPGQMVVVVTGVLLLISDGRYHWQNRAVAVRGLGLLALLAIPFLRFRLNHPDAMQDQLYKLGSYWVQSISTQEKLRRFAQEYLYGLSPGYWFIPNSRDLVRHLMKGYGHLNQALLPLALVGLVICIKNFRSPAHRAVLIAFLAAPTGAALAMVGVTRALVMVIPGTLFIALGLIALLSWLEKKWISRHLLSLGIFGVLALMNFFMLGQALTKGPTWYNEYGLGGMQYGARQVFSEVQDYLKDNPSAIVVVSPSWMNGADVVARFFMGDPMPARLGSIEEYIFQHLPEIQDKVFVMTAEEFKNADTSGKFIDITVERTIPYPNGETGFYFVKLDYAPNVDEILAAEQLARRQLQEAQVYIDGQPAKVRHSQLDMGQIKDLWDGYIHSVARTLEANPFVIEVTFDQPRSLSGLSLIVGDTEVRVLARLYPAVGADPVEYVDTLRGTVQDQEVSVDFGQVHTAQVIYLEVNDLQQGEPGHVHLWEIYFR